MIPKLYCESIEIDCPDNDFSYRSRPPSPSPFSRNYARSPSPLTFSVPNSSPNGSKTNLSKSCKEKSKSSQDGYEKATASKISTFLELPEQFRSRSKSLDDGKRGNAVKPQLDCASTYKIYDSILKKGKIAVNFCGIVKMTIWDWELRVVDLDRFHDLAKLVNRLVLCFRILLSKPSPMPYSKWNSDLLFHSIG